MLKQQQEPNSVSFNWTSKRCIGVLCVLFLLNLTKTPEYKINLEPSMLEIGVETTESVQLRPIIAGVGNWNLLLLIGACVLVAVLGSALIVLRKKLKDRATPLEDKREVENEVKPESIAKEEELIREINDLRLITEVLENQTKNSEIRDKIREIKHVLVSEAKAYDERIMTLENDDTKSGKLDVLLKIHFPSLSERDIKLCHFIFLGLRSTDIAFINSVEVQSVKTAKHRLKKKLNLSSDDTIKKFLEEFVGSSKKINKEDISFSTESNSIKQPEPSTASLHADSKKAQL